MRMHQIVWRLTISLLLPFILNACSSSSPAFRFPELPVYEVVDSAVTLESAKQFASALGVESDDLVDDNIIRYINEERFGRLPMLDLDATGLDEDNNPTRAEGFDFDAIAAITPYSSREALSRVKAALEATGLEPEAGSATVKHSLFEVVTKEGSEIASVKIDTQVVFRLTAPNGVDLKGPGAEIKVVFDSEGVVTQIAYALCRLREGVRVEVQPQAEAQKLAAAKYLGLSPAEISLQDNCSANASGTLCLSAEVAYYAPPPALRVETILPHYVFAGTFFTEGQAVPVRNIMVPVGAVAMDIDLKASQTAGTVTATANVIGGTPPYRYDWVSSSTDLAPLRTDSNEASIRYQLEPRFASSEETLSLIVTDANNVSNWTSEVLGAEPSDFIQMQQTTQYDVGAQWIGLSQGLPGSVKNVDGFTRTMAGAAELKFNYGEDATSKLDFVDPVFGGRDDTGIDSVDLAFYTGHATGSGWTFESSTDRFLFYDEAKWGNQDLEWLIVAACGPLQTTTSGLSWWQRWGPAFDGLHMLLGYANITLDNPYEGGLLGTYLVDKQLPLRQAWILSATETQSPDEIIAIMGVWGKDGLSHYNDHFWGQGEVAPDIPANEVKGFWRLTAPS